MDLDSTILEIEELLQAEPPKFSDVSLYYLCEELIDDVKSLLLLESRNTMRLSMSPLIIDSYYNSIQCDGDTEETSLDQFLQKLEPTTGEMELELNHIIPELIESKMQLATKSLELERAYNLLAVERRRNREKDSYIEQLQRELAAINPVKGRRFLKEIVMAIRSKPNSSTKKPAPS